MDLCWQSNVSAFQYLVITFLPRSKHPLISWLQSPSAVILEPPKIKCVTVSILWVRPFSSWFSVIVINSWPSVCSLKIKLAGFGDSYLFTILQIFKPNISCENTLFWIFQRLLLEWLQNWCRTVVLIRGSAHRNYFSGINYIHKQLLVSTAIYCIQCWVLRQIQKQILCSN